MNFPGAPLVEATVVGRLNRFTVGVRLRVPASDGAEWGPGGGEGHGMSVAHLPNSGRLKELLMPGNRCYLRPALVRADGGTVRRTAYDLLLVEHRGGLVCVDARLPPQVLKEAALAGKVPAFSGYPAVVTEPAFHKPTRFDLRFERPESPPFWVETKSVTLVRDSTALFPDAPTERGARHLDDLRRVVAEGAHAAVVFVIQREDARAFAPNIATDPEFAQHLRRARDGGVLVAAWDCQVTPDGTTLGRELPVLL